MGNSYSEDARHSSSDSPVGYRVLSVDPNGPASKGRVVSLGPKLYPSDDALEQARQQQVEREGQPALVSFFDFILSINGIRLSREDTTFAQEIMKCEGKAVLLEIWNAKAGRLRVVEVTPCRWEGNGLLGLAVRFGTYLGTLSNALHVTEVYPGSPAEHAGLVASDDWILGAADAMFTSVDEFSLYLDVMAGSVVHFFVHSAGRDSVREISVLVPNRGTLDDETDLGCTVTQGFFHQLPTVGTPGRNEYVGDRMGRRRLLSSEQAAHTKETGQQRQQPRAEGEGESDRYSGGVAETKDDQPVEAAELSPPAAGRAIASDAARRAEGDGDAVLEDVSVADFFGVGGEPEEPAL